MIDELLSVVLRPDENLIDHPDKVNVELRVCVDLWTQVSRVCRGLKGTIRKHG